MYKIFYWSPYLSNVATINNVLNSALSLAKYSKKFEISLINAFGEWNVKKDLLKKNNIKIEKLSSLNINLPIIGYLRSRIYLFLIFLINFFPFLNLLKNKKPDYVIIHLLTSLPLILLFLFNFKTKFILRISGLPKLNFLRKLLWIRISKKIFMVTCPSIETYNQIKELEIFPKDKITILYDPIIKISDIIDKKKEIFDKNISENFYLSVGRLTRQKNHILLLKAFLKQIKKNKDIILYIIGDGERENYLKNFIMRNNLNKNIFLLGHKKNVFPFFYKAKATIITSLWEDPGAVMIESAFCNTPIISSDCKNGPSEFIMNNEAGYLFKSNDLKSLSTVIDDFINKPDGSVKQKIITAKKRCKKFTFFNHYKKMKSILNV
tara:strand:- start:1045 stop:2181 length:1137 start_codon:yes stop_codon:yes gene_type:complete